MDTYIKDVPTRSALSVWARDRTTYIFFFFSFVFFFFFPDFFISHFCTPTNVLD